MNSEIIFLITNLITLENEKSLIFIFNNFHFETLILIIKKNHEIFIIIIITKCNEIVNVEINQI